MEKENQLQVLKSHAYDCLSRIEMWQKQLVEINKQIGQVSQELESQASQEKEVKKDVKTKKKL